MGVFLGGGFSAVRERFLDTFTRNNRDDLGVATDGSLWSEVRPGIAVTDEGARSSTPAAYPLSTVDMPKGDVTINLKGISQGSGAALWVQSSTDWWAVTASQSPRTIPAYTYNAPATYNYNDTVPAYNYNATGSYQYNYSIPGTSYTYSVPYTYSYNVPGTTYYYMTDYNYQNPIYATYTASSTAAYTYYTVSYTTRIGTRTVAYTYYMYQPFMAGTGYKSVDFTYTVSFSVAHTGYKTTYSTKGYTYYESAVGSKIVSGTYSAYTSTGSGSYTASGSYAGSSGTANASYTYGTSIPAYGYIAVGTYTYATTVPPTVVYDQKISLKHYVGNAATLVTSWVVSSAETAKALAVKVLGKQVRVTAFSDVSQNVPLGNEVTYTASAANPTPKFGIVLSPSDYNQGTTVATEVDIHID